MVMSVPYISLCMIATVSLVLLLNIRGGWSTRRQNANKKSKEDQPENIVEVYGNCGHLAAVLFVGGVFEVKMGMLMCMYIACTRNALQPPSNRL